MATNKIGRNDPCPCGSGKKFKQCCALLPSTSQPVAKAHDGGVPRAIDWLETYHRKAMLAALDAMLFDGLSPEEQARFESLDQETMQGIHLNAMEWLLAEGYIWVKETEKRVAHLLLDKGGPLFTVGQRQWIQQLSEQPLRLYYVTDVQPQQQMTLCDALDNQATPMIVEENAGSQVSLIGSLIGARLMQVDTHMELSGGVYPFNYATSTSVIALAKQYHKQAKSPKAAQAQLSYLIRRKWLEQFIRPTIPTFMDAQSGKPILFITDHYRVNDWDALSNALASKKDVEGDRDTGWNRLKTYPDGLTRSLSNINISTTPERIELFHKTEAEADKGRKWFDKLVGEAAIFIGREISDPMGMINNSKPPKQGKPATKKTKNQSPSQAEIHPDIIANLIEQRIHQLYANWADEPIPSLGDMTPRQAMATATGLERVKGLLRSYEESEEQQAKEQGRRVISYAFLWSSIGLTPD